MRKLRETAFLLSRWVAIAACAALLIEQFRSFFWSDTLCLFPIAIVTDRGNLYVASDFTDDFVVASEQVERGSVPWLVQRTTRGTKSDALDDGFLGIGGFFGDRFTLIKLPIVLVLPVPALYLVWWHARFTRRTYYLACPTCGYQLSDVVYTNCPECGSPVFSRVVEALPASAGPRRARPGHAGSRSPAPG